MESLDRQKLEGAVRSYRAGLTDDALEMARDCLDGNEDVRLHAIVVIGESLLVAGRIDELGEHLVRFQEYRHDPRVELVSARYSLRIGLIDIARDQLFRLLAESTDRKLIRSASFDLVGIFDREGDYSTAWRIATEEHARSTREYPIDLLEKALAVTASAAEKAGRLKVRRATRDVERTAFLAGVPRSGTSLLEQMLDRHTRIDGIGENSIPGNMADAIAADGRAWPSGAQSVPTHVLDHWQKRYHTMVRESNGVPLECWSIDKTVFPMFQPLAVACVLPGARVVRIVRDARDTAVSLLLSNMDPSWGWTSSLETIYRLIAAERAFVKPIMAGLGIENVEVRYERLVENPQASIELVLSLLDLDLEDACLRPHENPRVVMTLSNEQVRKPINRQAIGRWKNYAPFMSETALKNLEMANGSHDDSAVEAHHPA